MDFSSLVLMEREKETQSFVRELGSYKVGEGAEYITKMYYDGEKVNVYFDTKRDVEEWEYTAVYDVLNEEVFEENGFKIEDVEDEFNPTWKVTFEYSDDHNTMEEKLLSLSSIIKEELERVFEAIKGRESEYPVEE